MYYLISAIAFNLENSKLLSFDKSLIIIIYIHCKRCDRLSMYFVGEDDILQCFKCDLKLKNWKAHDDPMREHASHSRDCQYVIQKMGDDYVKSACRQVQANIEHKLVR